MKKLQKEFNFKISLPHLSQVGTGHYQGCDPCSVALLVLSNLNIYPIRKHGKKNVTLTERIALES